MNETVTSLTSGFFKIANESHLGFFLTLILFTGMIVLYSTLIFYFYKFLAKKNIIELNLSSHNIYEAGLLFRVVSTAFYILEYIIILPFITSIWFAILSILLLALSNGLEVQIILLISAALVASVRITSYISEDLARDLAKMLPLTLLGVALTSPKFFDFSALISRLTEIPQVFTNILYYIIFIMAVELIMRFYDIFDNSISGKEELVDEEYQS